MKKGIVEMADVLVVNKADGDNQMRARMTKKDYEHALHMMPRRSSEWVPEVLLASALEFEGISEVWQCLERFQREGMEAGVFQARRSGQVTEWFYQTLEALLHEHIFKHSAYEKAEAQLIPEIRSGRLSPVIAARSVLSSMNL
jgi:LAO/AO transport system kinase